MNKIFNNGIYNLETFSFFPNKKEDFKMQKYYFLDNNKKLNYLPYEEYDINIRNEMFTYLKQMINDDSNLNDLLILLSNYFVNRIDDIRVICIYGSFRSGKTIFITFLCNVFHSCNLPLLTIQKSIDIIKATPEIVTLINQRSACIHIKQAYEYCEQSDYINETILEQLTGNDNIRVRALFKNLIELKLSFVLFITSNKMLEFNSIKLQNRTKYIYFKSKFVDNPRLSNEYLADYELKNKIKEWSPILASYLIYLYENNNKEYVLK